MATQTNVGIRSYSKNLEREIPKGKAYINLCPFENNVILQIDLISEMGISFFYNYLKREEKGTMGKGGHISVYKEVAGNKVINPDFSFDLYNGEDYNEETGLKLKKTNLDRYGFLIETTLEDKLKNRYVYVTPVSNYPQFVYVNNENKQSIRVNQDNITVYVNEKKAVLTLVDDSLIGQIDYYENSKLIKTVYVEYQDDIVSRIIYKNCRNLESHDGETSIYLKANVGELIIKDEITNDGEKYSFSYGKLESISSINNDSVKKILSLSYNEYSSLTTIEPYNKNTSLTTIEDNKNKEHVYFLFDSVNFNGKTCYYNSISYDDDGAISCCDYNDKLQKKYENSFDEISLNHAIYEGQSLNLLTYNCSSYEPTGSVEMALLGTTGKEISNPNISKTINVCANGSDSISLTYLVKSKSGLAKLTTSIKGGDDKQEIEVNVNKTLKMVCLNLDVINSFDTLDICINGQGEFVIGSINIFRHSMANFYQYDESGNNLGNGTLEYKNNLVSGIISENSVKYNLEYNKDNELTSFKAPYGVSVNLSYNNHDISKQIISSNGYRITSEMSYKNHKLIEEKNSLGTTEYVYDDFGSLYKVKNALGHITKNVYDNFGDVIGLILKEEDDNSNDDTDQNVSYEYDSKRNISKITIKNGTVYTFEYDKVTNNLLKILLNGTCVFRYFYDENEHIISQYFGESSDHFDFEYSDKYLITKITYSKRALSYVYSYDEYDRLTEIKEVTSNSERILETYIYNQDGIPYKTKLANSTISKDFDNLGHTSRVKTTFPSETIIQEHDTIDRSKGSNPESLIQDFYKNNDYCITPFMEDCHAHSNSFVYGCYTIDESSSNRFRETSLSILSKDGNLPYFTSAKKVCYAMFEKAKHSLACETVAFWFKSSSHNDGCILSLGYQNGKSWLKVFERNGKIILQANPSNNKQFMTVLEIPSDEYELNKWNFFSLDFYTRWDYEDDINSFEGQALIHINSKTFEKHWTGDPIRMDLSSSNLLLTLGYELDYNNLTTSNLKSGMSFTLIAIGRRQNLRDDVVMSLYRKTRDYIVDNFYLNGDVKAVDYAVTSRYKKTSTVSSCQIFPLENSLYSLDYDSFNPSYLSKPKTFDLRFGTSIDKDRTFNFNKKLDRYAYVADGNKLVYETDMTLSGTIAGMFYFAEDGKEQYLFEAESGHVKFGLCRKDDVLTFIYGSKVCSTKIKLNTDKWYKIALSYDTPILPDSGFHVSMRDIRIMCDNQEAYFQIVDANTLSNVSVMVGRRFEETEITQFAMWSKTSYPLFGQIANLVFSSSYNNPSTSSDLFDNMNDFIMTKYYDEMGLLINDRIKKNNVKIFEKDYKYNSDSLLLKSETFKYKDKNINRYYSYDNLGNLTRVSDTYNGISNSSSYTYDYRGYLVSETNSNGTIKYSYDDNGNILQRGNNIFKYDSNCPDKLIAYNGSTVKYSALNPGNITELPYYEIEYEGRRVKTITYYISSSSRIKNYVKATYTYNDKGLRIGKSLEYYRIISYALIEPVPLKSNKFVTDDVTHINSLPTEKTRRETVKRLNYTYEYDGDKLIYEKSEEHTIYYLYDENNEIYGYTIDGKTYYYVKDRFNNILGIIDENGKSVVQYQTDAYGNVITEDDSIYNPIRYKGYYYDSEIGLYYCQSRYYAPFLCRWINMDNPNFLDTKSINGLNLFAYCNNNPVMIVDEDGKLPQWANWVIGGACIAGAIALTVCTAGLGTLIAGAIGSGIVASIAGGAVAGAVVGAVSGTLINVGTQTISVGFENIDGMSVLKSAGVGAISGAIAGGIFGGINYKLSEATIAQAASRLSRAEEQLNSAFMPLNSVGKFTGMPFSGNNIAHCIAQAASNYNNAYNAYIIAKSTYTFAYGLARAGYIVASSLLSDIIGLIF